MISTKAKAAEADVAVAFMAGDPSAAEWLGYARAAASLPAASAVRGLLLRDLLPGGCHAPDRIADIVGDQQRARFVDGKPDGTSARVILVVKKSGYDILRHTAWLAIAEGYEHDLVAVEHFPVPAAMLAHECAAGIGFRQVRPGVERKPQRSDVRRQRVVWRNRLRHEVRTLRLDEIGRAHV